MMEPSWAILQAADDALMSRMYMPRSRRLGPLRLASHPALLDPEWNRMRVLENSSDLEAWVRRGVAELSSGGRYCSVEVGPSDAGLEEKLRAWNFRLAFRHDWIVLDLETTPGPEHFDAQNMVEVRPVGRESIDAFISVFHRGFASDDDGNLGDSWNRAVRSMLESSIGTGARHEPRMLHFLAFSQGQAVGVATLGITGSLAGLYNLAVSPRFRKRGIARQLMAHRLREAKALGATTAFLQAEDEPVYRWHLRSGYRAGPVVCGWRPPYSPDRS